MFSRQNKLANKKIAPIAASAFVALVVVGGLSLVPAANAAVSFNPSDGTGFVGKGDVQRVLGLNNKQIQALCDQTPQTCGLSFSAISTVVTEVTWECSRQSPGTGEEIVQERARETTTTTQGVLSSVARERNQVTGFNLMGYAGDKQESSTTDGPAINSCPTGSASNPWTLKTPAGSPEVISSTSQLFVNGQPLN